MVENQPNKIVIHCSASDIAEDDTVSKLRILHTCNKDKVIDWGQYKYINCFGWSDIGYHYFITRDGRVHDCRPLKNIPAGVKGQNKNSVQICLSGLETFEEVQFVTLARVVKNLMEAFPAIILDRIYGHRDFNNKKTCPNFWVEDFVTKYLKE